MYGNKNWENMSDEYSDVPVDLLSRVRQKFGLETDSGSRWFMLTGKGLGFNEASAMVFAEKGLLKKVGGKWKMKGEF